ncbi:MAG: hypothetical protein FXF47_09640 [Candidatus Mcinerneyibacterium aminivorans]|uniref:Uncharacterized protein n=1 Tax=Candidatus Mcinerneyibacterium aminivorans TaxID=2703815 RepID=A0A5D0MIH4_9BACT|nr:MAG: hypothetical protein FXF47_09640 [Candidatus Mcinerneyibacterium aminivorans]
MPFQKLILSMILCLSVVFASSGEIADDNIIFNTLLNTEYDRIIDFPYLSKINWIQKKESDKFSWQFSSKNIITILDDVKEGLTFSNRLYLYDSDVFYGRENFPEARSMPLFKGNNYNLTFNNDLLRSDDYILREGTIKNNLDVYFKKKFDEFKISGNFSFKSGQNLESRNSYFEFKSIKLIKDNSFSMEIGKITPHFDDLNLDKQNTPVTGVQISKKWKNTNITFVAARPDIPLEFGFDDTDRVVVNVNDWNKDKPYIYNFEKPYNYFDIEQGNIPVFINAYRDGAVIEITNSCIINHGEVIIPSQIMNGDYDRIEITYNRTNTDQQLIYLNAFDFNKTLFKNTKIGISYVDLHNDTHSVTNLSSNFAPFDSNIWSINLESSFNNLNWLIKVFQSKIVPDDYKYDKREIDYVYYFNTNYKQNKFEAQFEYSWIGGDYLLNVIPLSHKWKLVEDSNSDFNWDYHKLYGELGEETYDFSIEYENFFTHNFNVSYAFNLKSNYKNSEYALYDRFYIPYYSQTGNEYNLYGEGIDDGKKDLILKYKIKKHNIEFMASYKKVIDPDLHISNLEKNYEVYTGDVKYENGNLSLSINYDKKYDFVYYSPQIENFIKQKEDSTLQAAMQYNNRFNLFLDLFLNIRENFKYIYDADSLYNDKDWYFKQYIIPDMDTVDENIIQNSLFFELLYKFSSRNYLTVYYDIEGYSGEVSNYSSILDYRRTRRGIKYFSNLEIENLFLVAFYDEDELFFDKQKNLDYTRKEIGALIQFKF